MSSQMSSQEVENNPIVLQSKDLRQLMGLASLDMKLNKNAILKINISEALSLVNRSISQIEIRLYGNVVFSISKGILKTLNVITLDLKETIDLMRKNIKLGRKEEAVARFPKLSKQEKPQLPTMTPTESERDVSTVEKVRNVSKEDSITLRRDLLTSDRRLFEMDFPHDSVLAPGFAEELDGMQTGGLEYLSESGGRPLSFGGEHIQFEISTPSRIGEFISPRKQKQAFTNLDAYLESVKKEERPIFRDLTQPDEEEKTTKKKKDEARRRKSRKVEFTAELETRWDYDEKLDIEKPEEVKEKTDADTFIDKVQAPTAMPIQQRLSVNLDHFMDAFSTDKLAQFNEKVKGLREEQLPIPRRQTTGRKVEEESIERFGPFDYQPDDQLFPMPQGSDIGEIPHLAPLEEKSQIIGEGSIFQVGRLEEIGLSLDRERFDENLSITEVFDNIKSMEKEQKKKDKKSKLTFDNLSKNESKPGKASMFYEVLNLAKENKVILSQTKNYFGDIEIEVV